MSPALAQDGLLCKGPGAGGYPDTEQVPVGDALAQTQAQAADCTSPVWVGPRGVGLEESCTHGSAVMSSWVRPGVSGQWPAGTGLGWLQLDGEPQSSLRCCGVWPVGFACMLL